MVYKKYTLNTLFRLLLVIINTVLLVYLVLTVNEVFLISNLLILLIIQIVLFIRFTNRINKELELFFDTVGIENNLVTYSKRKERRFNHLFTRFDQINSMIHKNKEELIQNELYFSVVMDHIGVGFLSFDDSGNVDIINKKAKSIFKIDNLTSIHQLKKLNDSLPDFLDRLKSDIVPSLKLVIDNQLMHLSFRTTILKIKGKVLKLVVFQDIRRELDEKELDSWQKIIRVITHEIMNSVAPISSTIDAIQSYYDEINLSKEKLQIESRKIGKTISGLDIIKERSEGLRDFVVTYRNLITLPKPDIQKIKIIDLFEGLSILLNDTLKKEVINIEFEVNPFDLTLDGDHKLIQQMLLNLLKNGIDSIVASQVEESERRIKLKGFKQDDRRIVIQVCDNGKGIKQDILDQIFIPFFTTKNNGSGIGLSLSKQIMQLHKGDISVVSKPFVETIFTLTF